MLALALLHLQSSVLSDEDKAVIEAAITQKERDFGHRIVFVADTAQRRMFMNLLNPPDKQLTCVKELLRRNARSVSLEEYVPSWASLSASGNEAVGWYGNRSSISQENYLDWISLPAYNEDHSVAAIYLSALVHDPSSGNRRVGGKSMILRLKRAGDKWQVDGIIGRCIAS